MACTLSKVDRRVNKSKSIQFSLFHSWGDRFWWWHRECVWRSANIFFNLRSCEFSRLNNCYLCWLQKEQSFVYTLIEVNWFKEIKPYLFVQSQAMVFYSSKTLIKVFYMHTRIKTYSIININHLHLRCSYYHFHCQFMFSMNFNKLCRLLAFLWSECCIFRYIKIL